MPRHCFTAPQRDVTVSLHLRETSLFHCTSDSLLRHHGCVSPRLFTPSYVTIKGRQQLVASQFHCVSLSIIPSPTCLFTPSFINKTDIQFGYISASLCNASTSRTGTLRSALFTPGDRQLVTPVLHGPPHPLPAESPFVGNTMWWTVE